ncbi:helicase-like transcription factor [Oncorhynchus clarkii lewisi]|uniref:helicase-like transcription factor n=1 Tax=Oncorhynchus clarkii lewisi TaxID=490388 RepID=UPI0039B95CF7
MLRLVLGSGSDEECAVCLDCPFALHHALCTQVYCRLCSAEVVRTKQEQTRCPLCRGQINANELVEFPQEEEEDESNLSENWRSSSKVEAVMSSLLRLHSEENGIQSQKQNLVEKAFGFPRERKTSCVDDIRALVEL